MSEETVFCLKCRLSISSVDKFCPHCGESQSYETWQLKTIERSQQEAQETEITRRRRDHPLLWPLVSILLTGSFIGMFIYLKNNSFSLTASDKNAKINGRNKKEKTNSQTTTAPTQFTNPNNPIKTQVSSQGRSVNEHPVNSRVPNNKSLGYEPPPRPVPNSPDSVRIGNARIAVENDGHGHEFATGRVLIVNNGRYPVTDFRLGLEVMGLTYVLAPFEGSLTHPRPIYSFDRHIPPGGQLDVPVMTTGEYSSYSAYGIKKVTLQASIDGPPGIVTDEVTIM